MSNTERRGVARKTEIEERSDGSLVLTGYAAVFYRDGDESTQFRLWPGAVERVTPGAFSRTLKEGRSVALFNHDDTTSWATRQQVRRASRKQTSGCDMRSTWTRKTRLTADWPNGFSAGIYRAAPSDLSIRTGPGTAEDPRKCATWSMSI
jgi:phage head maturation protease